MADETLPDNDPALILVRHGETEWSKTGKHTGRSDVPLTPAGEEQAREAGRLIQAVLGDRRPDLVISSPRIRASHTAKLAGFTPAEVTEDAAEWDYGDLEGRTSAEISEQFADWSIWSGPVPGGETAEQVSARADRVIARRQRGQTLMVFSHGHFSRCLAARWLGQPVTAGQLLRLGTGAVSSLGFEHGRPAVLHWNLDSDIAAALA